MQVSVIGLGYVGSVTAGALARNGHSVLGVDEDGEKVAMYRSGKVPIFEPGLRELIDDAVAHQRLSFFHTSEVTDFLGDLIVIAVGTPPTETGAANLSYVRSAINWVTTKQAHGIILMKSTVPPGTGVRISGNLLRGSGLEYVSNPEFLREGQAIADWFHPNRIIVGSECQEAVQVVKDLYQGIDAPYVITDVTTAEMIKYASNAFLATKISFINEIANLSDKVGAIIDDVSYGMSLDPRIGPSFLKAGVGYGGSCFPKDVRALDNLALTNDHNFEVLRAVVTVNNRQRLLPLFLLRQRFGSLTGVKVGVLGLAFKPGTDDVRDAPAVDLINCLVVEEAAVKAFDPQAVLPSEMKMLGKVQLTDSLLDCVDGTQALVLMTEWPEIVEANWAEIAQRVMPPKYLIDGRNALDPQQMFLHGFSYCGIGRRARGSMKNHVVGECPKAK